MESLQKFVETESTFAGRGGALYRRSVQSENPVAVLGVIHGYGDHSGRYAHFMRWMAERGVACHANDLRGQGRSAGRRGYIRRWDEYLEDVESLLSMNEMKTGRPTFLLGHSHGGLLVAAAVERGIKGITGCVLTSPYFAPKLKVPRYKIALAHLLNPVLPWMPVRSGLGDEMMTSDAAMRAESHADALIGHAATPRWYLSSLEAQRRVLAEAGSFRLPLSLLFGAIDPVADLAVATRFFESVGSTDKAMKIYPGLLHEMLRETRRDAVFKDILEWIRAR